MQVQMHIRILVQAFLGIALLVDVVPACAAGEAWEPRTDCPIAQRSYDGLVPAGIVALKALRVEHRITQTINSSTAPSNYHGRDLVVEGRDVTAAVDISVRCLDSAVIRHLLSQLALAGFAAWYREDGRDDWKGPTHIHAVWASQPLKVQLQKQISSWLGGKTGLVGNAKYLYWQPSDAERAKIAAQVSVSN